ncbi:hypothetical protein ACFL60_10035, partial [Candidatus Omnitrophota bacterium]
MKKTLKVTIVSTILIGVFLGQDIVCSLPDYSHLRPPSQFNDSMLTKELVVVNWVGLDFTAIWAICKITEEIESKLGITVYIEGIPVNSQLLAPLEKFAIKNGDKINAGLRDCHDRVLGEGIFNILSELLKDSEALKDPDGSKIKEYIERINPKKIRNETTERAYILREVNVHFETIRDLLEGYPGNDPSMFVDIVLREIWFIKLVMDSYFGNNNIRKIYKGKIELLLLAFEDFLSNRETRDAVMTSFDLLVETFQQLSSENPFTN